MLINMFVQEKPYVSSWAAYRIALLLNCKRLSISVANR
jgi:hypothetical protein